MQRAIKKVLAIPGSIRKDSASTRILRSIAEFAADDMQIELYENSGALPHFNPDLDGEGAKPPQLVADLRERIRAADGVIFCTPEYVFSLPGSLKNVLEWTVSTTVFAGKPVAVITASASGIKAHEALELILRTLGARLDNACQLLIQGARAKIRDDGQFADTATAQQVKSLTHAFYAALTASHDTQEKSNES